MSSGSSSSEGSKHSSVLNTHGSLCVVRGSLFFHDGEDETDVDWTHVPRRIFLFSTASGCLIA